MQIRAIKTHKITEEDTDITQILDKYLQGIVKEKSVVAISSKIVAICEGSIVKVDGVHKDALVEEEADMYLPRTSNKYGVCISIKNGMFIASAGIDESNGNGNFVLWPKDPQQSANIIREYLSKKFGLSEIGVIITDSKSAPLRWGVTGVAIAHSGFSYLNSYVGQPDVFGRLLHVEKVNVPDTLAAAAVGEMGEGQEQTPLAIIADAQFVHFQQRNPSSEELAALAIRMEDDMYAGLLTKGAWQNGHAKRNRD